MLKFQKVDQNNEYELIWKRTSSVDKVEDLSKFIESCASIILENEYYFSKVAGKLYLFIADNSQTPTQIIVQDVENFNEQLSSIMKQKTEIAHNSILQKSADEISLIRHIHNNNATIALFLLNHLKKDALFQERKDLIQKASDIEKRICKLSQYLESRRKVLEGSKAGINAAELIDICMQSFEEPIRLNNINLSRQGKGDFIVLEPSLCLYALNAIFENAIEALKEIRSNRKLNVELSNNDNQFSIKISNNGPHINESNLTQIFQTPFTNKMDGKHNGNSLHFAYMELIKKGIRLKVIQDADLCFEIQIPWQNLDFDFI